MVSTMAEYDAKMDWVKEELGGKCVKCGSTNSLHVHHLRDKKFTVSSKWGLSKDALRTELRKCELQCVKCHRATHEKPHGTEARYRHSACRCSLCKEAHRKGTAKYREVRKREDPMYRRVG